MNKVICPYPGLRPFTEEEALYFKGRDLHIRQIINKLEEKKIIIITGASGDGKSSLVYAGVVPNARAGFFRADFNNWLIADFRPERTPLDNLAAALSKQLKMSFGLVRKELSFGFSSLIDLFKSSLFYVNTNSPEYQQLDVKAKKRAKNNAANLLIIADQFEEIFTNSENYTQGKASNDAYTVVNLLLETAKISLRDDLPVYVAFTMRSDYISQCVAFRGLPETIGFSQFFVPRLNRSEIQQIIEEPARLAGGECSKRLKEVLINEMHEGFDQLPVLQHTLNRLWKNAVDGQEHIDIIHYAYIAGISNKFLDGAQKDEFNQWLDKLAPDTRRYFENPASDNVLNAHANLLYDDAYQYFTINIDWAKKDITEDDAKLIMKIAFQCLTKIDQGRAVRNRMTIKEITQIINQPHIKADTVCGILNIFRLPENTFIRPFIDYKDISTQFLSSNTILDITHEALIRNWKYLVEWNREETENLNDFREFEIQLNRWLKSNKSIEYLLPIGPLSYFEAWFERSRPNKYWLAKYDESGLGSEEKIQKSGLLEENIKDYLKTSRDRITLLNKQQKRRRTYIVAASIATATVLSFITFVALREKNEAQLQRQIAVQQTDSATFQRNLAVEANKAADAQRLIAEDNAIRAINARKISDSARNEAERLRIIALEKSELADNEAKKALTEKSIADQQRQIADQQRQKAIEASENAKSLSYLSMAQSLGLKATKKYTDNQMNILLALTAYKFNENNKGPKLDPIIFDAVKYASEINGFENTIDLINNEISSFYFSDGKINIFTEQNNCIIYNIDQQKIESEHLYDFEVPVNFSSYLSDNYVVVSLETRETYLINTNTTEKLLLPGITDYVRSACMSGTPGLFYAAGRSGKIYQWGLNLNPDNNKTFSTNSRINSIFTYPSSNYIYAGISSGKVMQINNDLEYAIFIDERNERVQSVSGTPDKKYLAGGFSDGALRIYNLANNTLHKEVKISNAGISDIAFDNQGNIVAALGDDNKIYILPVKSIDQLPIVITPSLYKVSNITIFNNRLYAICKDRKIRFWELDENIYVSYLKKQAKRNFSDDEWNIHVGEQIPVQKIIETN